MTTTTELMGIARFTFHEGQVEEFKRLSAECMDIVRTQDTGTLQYDTYLNADETRAIVIERYRDSEAAIEHNVHIGPEMMEKVMATADIEGELLGTLTPELEERMAGAPVGLLTLYRSLDQP
jgi:quinol monooxygenase YgiN